MASSYLVNLVQIAARIVELDRLESEVTDKREWKRGKEEWDALREQFNNRRSEYIAALFGDDAPGDNVPDEVRQELAGLREEADSSWSAAIDYTEANLLPQVQKEAGTSPRMRKARRAAPFVIAAIVIAGYFGVALFSGTPVTDPIESREGIVQRAAAAKKVIRYDDWADTRVRRGGWFKGRLLWPIEPDPYEVKGAGEFVGLVLEAQQYAKGCDSIAGSGDTLSSQQIDMINEAADIVRSDALQWDDPAPITVVSALEKTEACKGS